MKKLMLFAIVAITGFVFMPTVNAQYMFETPNFDKNITQTGAGTKESPYILKLEKDAKQDFEIKDGIYVEIDLNGHTLQNYTTENCSVIYIEDGTVTIKDSSAGEGKIQLQTDASTNLPTIGNKGTLIIEGGTIVANNGAHTDINHKEGNSTGILNYQGANLTINGGAIETANDTVWGITNLGKTVINDGTFNQKNKSSIIENSADMTINGGTFTSTDAEGQEPMITNDKGDLGVEGASILRIMGGDFQVDKVINEVGDGTTEISGGTYINPDGVKEYLVQGVEFDEEGNVIASPVSTETEESNPNTSDINLFMLMSLIVMSSVGLGYTIKKRFND